MNVSGDWIESGTSSKQTIVQTTKCSGSSPWDFVVEGHTIRIDTDGTTFFSIVLSFFYNFPIFFWKFFVGFFLRFFWEIFIFFNFFCHENHFFSKKNK